MNSNLRRNLAALDEGALLAEQQMFMASGAHASARIKKGGISFKDDTPMTTIQEGNMPEREEEEPRSTIYPKIVGDIKEHEPANVQYVPKKMNTFSDSTSSANLESNGVSHKANTDIMDLYADKTKPFNFFSQPIPIEPNNNDLTESQLRMESYRFDFNGRILSKEEQLALPTHLGLHHHGLSPSSAGYTLKELFLLLRSQFPAQRTASLQFLLKILKNTGTGEELLQYMVQEYSLPTLLNVTISNERNCTVVIAALEAIHALIIASKGSVVPQFMQLELVPNITNQLRYTEDLSIQFYSFNILKLCFQFSATVANAVAQAPDLLETLSFKLSTLQTITPLAAQITQHASALEVGRQVLEWVTKLKGHSLTSQISQMKLEDQ